MKARKTIYFIFFLTLSSGCAVTVDLGNEINEPLDNDFQKQSLLGILYAQTSTEFTANNIQTFVSASNNLDRAIQDTSWTAAVEQQSEYKNKPTAIILDIDETVLDNSAFQARTVLEGTSYPTGWIEWGNEANASAVAGVKDFLLDAQSKGIKIFYVTNRVAELEAATRKNLVALGLPLDQDRDVLMMKGENGWGSNKTSRRALIAEDYRIIMIFGDQLGDFLPRPETALQPDQRKLLAYRYKNMWGTKWFMLTNSMYGGWEAAIYNFNYPDNEDTATEIRMNNLKP